MFHFVAEIFYTFVNQVTQLLALFCWLFEAIHKFHCKSPFKKTFSEREAGIPSEVLILKPSEQPTKGNKFCLAETTGKNQNFLPKTKNELIKEIS